MLFSSTVSLLALGATTALAAPRPVVPIQATQQLEKRQYEPLNITYSSGMKEGLPRTLILATGGTIAGASASSTDSTGYRAGSIGVAALVEAVPELLNISSIDGIQVANVGSPSITDEILLDLAHIANQALCWDGAEYDSVVVTHGTDTLEETAFFLDATITCDKPVVIVGAMRPATAISADGPNNLLSAVATGVSPDARGRGALVVLNDRIGQAYWMAKRNAYEQGFVGVLLSIKPIFYYPPSPPLFRQVYDVANLTSLPRVDMVIAHQGVTYDTLNYSMTAHGVKAFVSSGVGSGGYSTEASANIAAAVEQGAIIVRTTQVRNGIVPISSSAATISAGFLQSTKARRLLQILLGLNKTTDEIRDAFEGKLSYFLNQNLTDYY
ncbi:hypothetical protein JCM8547_007636 [Rhodosporidiobolus lusitaniae]